MREILSLGILIGLVVFRIDALGSGNQLRGLDDALFEMDEEEVRRSLTLSSMTAPW